MLAPVIIGKIADGAGNDRQLRLVLVAVQPEKFSQPRFKVRVRAGNIVLGETAVLLLHERLIGAQPQDRPSPQFIDERGVQKGAARLLRRQVENLRRWNVSLQFYGDALHAGTPFSSAMRQKFSSISWPYSVSTASGWNCTPYIGSVRCESAITVPSSATQST